jgi:hypothetical protein
MWAVAENSNCSNVPHYFVRVYFVTQPNPTIFPQLGIYEYPSPKVLEIPENPATVSDPFIQTNCASTILFHPPTVNQDAFRDISHRALERQTQGSEPGRTSSQISELLPGYKPSRCLSSSSHRHPDEGYWC